MRSAFLLFLIATLTGAAEPVRLVPIGALVNKRDSPDLASVISDGTILSVFVYNSSDRDVVLPSKGMERVVVESGL